MSAPPLPDIAGLPLADDGPVFAEPWQAQAFAMAVALHGTGLFTWPQWAERLARVIAAAQAAGDTDRGDTYWHHWLACLEQMVDAHGVADAAELAAERDAWAQAARATPHGRPITLASLRSPR